MGPRPTQIDVPMRRLPFAVERYSLLHAVGEGVSWPARRRLPVPLRRALGTRQSLDPAFALALLDLAREEAVHSRSFGKALRRYAGDDADRLLRERLESAAVGRSLPGVGLVKEMDAEDVAEGTASPPVPFSRDLELTLLVFAKSNGRIFLSGKSPVVRRIRGGVILEMVRMEKGGWS